MFAHPALKRTLSIVSKSAFCLFCGYGLYQDLLSRSGSLLLLRMFTLQSNLLCFLVMLTALFFTILAPNNKWRAFAIVKACSTTALLLTGIVYNVLLTAYSAAPMGGITNTLLHIVCPLWMLADSLFFDRKGLLRWNDAPFFLAPPALYIAYVYIGRAFGIRFSGPGGYPYFFMDITHLGVWGVAKWVLFLSFAVFFAGCLYIAIDKLLRRARDKRIQRPKPQGK